MVWKVKISFATDSPNYGLMAIRYVIEYFWERYWTFQNTSGNAESLVHGIEAQPQE